MTGEPLRGLQGPWCRPRTSKGGGGGRTVTVTAADADTRSREALCAGRGGGEQVQTERGTTINDYRWGER